LEGLEHGLVVVAGLHALGGLVALPPLPAEDQGEAEDDAADEPGSVAAQPCQDAFALFVFVEQIVDCHRKAGSLPPAGGRGVRGMGWPRRADTTRAAGRAAGWPWMDSCAVAGSGNPLRPLAGQCATGAREPSEDTVKRATFARM